MKRMIKPFNVILLLLLLQQSNLFAQGDKEKTEKKYEFTKSRAINKTYNVTGNDRLVIENEFGRVEVHTWDRNEIKVDVSIETSATTEAVAERVIDGIKVIDNQSGGEISFKTTINGNDKNGKNESRNEKSTMHVNYTISMPASNPLHITNQFGATIIPDFKGEVELTSKFGSLTTGNLSSIKSIHVEFGKASFDNISSGNITVKYSKADFKKLTGNIKLNLEFCGKTRVNIDNSLSSLYIKASYSSINLRPSSDLSADYSISTSFGSFKNSTNAKFDGNEEDDNKDRGPIFDHKYSGRSGSGTIPVKVTASFGKVVLGEPDPDDMKDKEKSKSKSRTS